jgi:hypothetical protein
MRLCLNHEYQHGNLMTSTNPGNALAESSRNGTLNITVGDIAIVNRYLNHERRGMTNNPPLQYPCQYPLRIQTAPVYRRGIQNKVHRRHPGVDIRTVRTLHCGMMNNPLNPHQPGDATVG